MEVEESRPLGSRQLRALAHPLRVQLLGLLRLDGPATATQLAARVGESSGATSYHLRQLAAHGFVEDAPNRGTGRERWWQASFRKHSVRSEDFLYDPELRGSLDVYLHEVLNHYIRNAGRFLAEQDSWPREWVESSALSDYLVRLTPDRLRDLVGEIEAVIARFEAVPDHHEPGEEQVQIQIAAFPRRANTAEAPSSEGSGT